MQRGTAVERVDMSPELEPVLKLLWRAEFSLDAGMPDKVAGAAAKAFVTDDGSTWRAR
ncbi:hypothetical protein ACFVJ5_27955 [Nocardia sp. NPDC127606]|uniref:hypothetical protein n=1 Tax=Nocardia sp. NPDC127606 TaxID=3345406 RepID=UPI00364004C3